MLFNTKLNYIVKHNERENIYREPIIFVSLVFAFWNFVPNNIKIIRLTAWFRTKKFQETFFVWPAVNIKNIIFNIINLLY